MTIVPPAAPDAQPPTPYYSDDFVTLYHGRCEDILPTLAPESVDVLLVDPPYFQVKEDEWDRQWKKRDEFLRWLGGTLDAALPALKVSASVWLFTSAALASTVELNVVAPRFRVLNSIRWVKKDSTHNRAEIASLRKYQAAWEGIVFAEQPVDAYAAADYEGKKDALARVGAYLAGMREQAGMGRDELARGLFESGVYSSLQSASANLSLQEIGGQMLSRRTYEAWAKLVPLKPFTDLSADYSGAQRKHEVARAEYEHLRRPFAIDRATGPVTDVWDFPSVESYPGKHSCEKPLAMLDHMLAVSARPGATVLDYCAGSGSTLRAAKDRGLRAIGIEMDERWCEHAANRLAQDVLDFGDGAA